jgi:uncharacterized protein YlzI (FlbEa/FlbD family)
MLEVPQTTFIKVNKTIKDDNEKMLVNVSDISVIEKMSDNAVKLINTDKETLGIVRTNSIDDVEEKIKKEKVGNVIDLTA